MRRMMVSLVFVLWSILFSLGGIGKLTDGVIGGNENTWLAWNKSPVSIEFHFDTSHHFKIIRIYSMNNKYRSIRIKFDDRSPIEHHASSITSSLSNVFIDTIHLNKYGTIMIGKRVEIIFQFDNELLFLTEITFDNEPTTVVETTSARTTTTNCPAG
jgi:hypothetical protein